MLSRTSFMSALFALVSVAFVAVNEAQASSVETYNFARITNNANVDLGSQLSMTVSEGTSNAFFTFKNNVGIQSSITDIYFDDMWPKIFSSIVLDSSSSGVSFDSQATPKNLPGGNVIQFKADFSGDSNVPVMANGVNTSSEWVSFKGVWASGATYEGLLAALDNGDFRVGLHVQAIGIQGQSDSYVHTPPPPAVPLPAAAWLFGSALIGFVSLSNRRKV